MTTDTLTLNDFLLARIAEDETVAREAGGDAWRFDDEGGYVRDADWEVVVLVEDDEPLPSQATHIARHDPARALAECEAKRRIIGDAERFISHEGSMGHMALLALASVYRDHPDYCGDEWDGWTVANG